MKNGAAYYKKMRIVTKRFYDIGTRDETKWKRMGREREEKKEKE